MKKDIYWISKIVFIFCLKDLRKLEEIMGKCFENILSMSFREVLCEFL